MENLVIFFDKNKDILKIVANYKNLYNANVYEIETLQNPSFLDKLLGNKIGIKRCNLDLRKYQNIILVSSLWFGKIPTPVVKFLEQQTGKINNIIYVLYNNNKEDHPKEFEKIDKILNLRREKSYFVNVDKKDIHVRVYQ